MYFDMDALSVLPSRDDFFLTREKCHRKFIYWHDGQKFVCFCVGTKSNNHNRYFLPFFHPFHAVCYVTRLYVINTFKRGVKGLQISIHTKLYCRNVSQMWEKLSPFAIWWALMLWDGDFVLHKTNCLPIKLPINANIFKSFSIWNSNIRIFGSKLKNG